MLLEQSENLFLGLFRDINQVKRDPFREFEKFHEIQRRLIESTLDLEEKIRESKKNGDENLSKFRDTLAVLKSVGDSLAFIFIERWDLKPLSAKNSPGFISGKDGLKNELAVLEHARKRAVPAILADLTNCLRYGDVYLFELEDQGAPTIVEIKSSRGGGKAHRQAKKAKRVMDYLRTDRAEDLFVKGARMVRKEAWRKEVSYFNDITEVVDSGFRLGFEARKVENNVVYSAGTDFDNKKLTPAMEGLSEPTVFFLNRTRFDYLSYFPFPLAIEAPEALFDFYRDRTNITILIDFSSLTDELDARGFVTEKSRDDEFAITIRTRETSKDSPSSMSVSRHFLGRAAHEFLSLEWIVRETVRRAEHVLRGAAV